jgi:ribosome recycling factor
MVHLANIAQHVKPINTVILNSKLNLTPHGPKPETPTTLHIIIPPATGESRQQALAAASKAAEEAHGRIREARGNNQKKLRAMDIAKEVRRDDIQKAQKQMEDVVKAGNEEIKRILENSKKVLEG